MGIKTLMVLGGILMSSLLFATNPPVSSLVQSIASLEKPPAMSPQDKADTAELLQLSTEIVEKISQIQNKQQAIDSEIYVTAIPELEAEKRALQTELEELQLKKSQLETKQNMNTLKKQLQTSEHPKP